MLVSVNRSLSTTQRGTHSDCVFVYCKHIAAILIVAARLIIMKRDPGMHV